MAQFDQIEEKEILPHWTIHKKLLSAILLIYKINIFQIKRQKIFHIMH